MRVHSVVFIDVDHWEIQNHGAFHVAALFTRYDSTITIRCLETGQEICCTCPAGACWGWRYFREKWKQKFGE